MHLLFVDESGHPDDPLFSIGGLSVRADHWRLLDNNLGQVTEEFGWDPIKEFKWHEIVTHEVPHSVGDKAFSAIAASPVTVFTVLLRPVAGAKIDPRHFADPEDAYESGLLLLAARFNRYLREEGSFGVIVIDNRLPELDRRLRIFYDRLRRREHNPVHLDRLVDALLLSPSHFSRGLLAADLIVGMARGAKRRHDDAIRWREQLSHRFARHPQSGRIEGAGFVEYPHPPGHEDPDSEALLRS